MHTNSYIMSVYERQHRLGEHKHWCQATKQYVCSCAEFKPEKVYHTNGNSLGLLFKTEIAVYLWENLSSVAIFTCMKKSALHLVTQLAYTCQHTSSSYEKFDLNAGYPQYCTKSVSPGIIGTFQISTKA